MTEPASSTSNHLSAPRYFAIILAAGSGKRFSEQTTSDTLKQYQRIAGKTVLEHSVQRVCSALLPRACVLVHADGDTEIKRQHTTLPVAYVVGGLERMHSVLNGLLALTELDEPVREQDFVLIHDAARPCIKKQDLLNLINQTKSHPIGGLLATPVSSTVKRSSEFLVENTISRENLWLAQTPQLFRFGLLKNALDSAIQRGDMVTDDASALELMGHQPLIVRGSSSNIKITYAEDLALAQFYLGQQ